MKDYPIGVRIKLKDGAMEYMGIPKISIDDDHDELWSYVILDRNVDKIEDRKYLVSTYGRIYNIPKLKLMPIYKSEWKLSVANYQSVTLNYDSHDSHYLVHRLVALAFIPNPENKPVVNHIDGNPSHNWVWNLEWATLSENMLHAVRTGLKVDDRGEERPNAKWTDDEVRLICGMMAEGHKATFIYHALLDILKDPKVQYERVRTLYKHIIKKTHWTHISKDYDIDFTRFNYAKEQASVSKKNKKKNKKQKESLAERLESYSPEELKPL